MNRKLYQLHRNLFRRLEAEVAKTLGEQPPAIQHYAREYERDFRSIASGRYQVVGKQDLIRSIQAKTVIFIADFHTFFQAQKTALRLMRETLHPDQEWGIGIELIPSHRQPELNRFLDGNLSLEKFHRLIRYEEEWGFPWQNYAPLFEWARYRKVKMIALNRPKELPYFHPNRDTELEDRDLWAAGVITDWVGENSNRPRKMIVLYGEHHVASSHLPRALNEVSRAYLGKSIPHLIIHQNHHRLYWDLARKGLEHSVNAVQLRPGVFCVVSGPPWAKLQSLINWAEGDLPIQFEEEDEEESHSDLLSTMRFYGNTLADFLEVARVPFESLTVRTLGDVDFLDLVRTQAPSEVSFIRQLIYSNRRFYLAKMNTAYLPAPSENAASELAANHLLRNHPHSRLSAHALRPKNIRLRSAEDFVIALLESAFSFFGSLVINPKRKCDLIKDHQAKIRILDKTREDEIHARKLAVRLISQPSSLNTIMRSRLKFESVSTWLAARFAGQALGMKMHRAFVQESLRERDLRDFYFSRKNLGSPGFFELYEGLIQKTAKIRLEKTKRDRL